MDSLEDKNILVTGGCGSIGSSLVDRLLSFDPNTIRVFDNSESGLFRMQSEYEDHTDSMRFLLGDIRDRSRIEMAIENIDVVFHCAALKHVGLNEYNPFETVQTNVQGTQNMIRMSLEESVESFVGLSTDKASNPTSVMGATKLLSERLIIAANTYKGQRNTAFNCVRFGNVLGSRESVVPIFLRQIEEQGPIKVTDPEMTRFIMPIDRAIDLVFEAHKQMQNGEVFVFKMPSFQLGELAEAMRERFAPTFGYEPDEIDVEVVGPRPGERKHEKLISADEMVHTEERDEMFVIHPQIDISGYNVLGSSGGANTLNREFTSADADLLNRVEIIELIESVGILTPFFLKE